MRTERHHEPRQGQSNQSGGLRIPVLSQPLWLSGHGGPWSSPSLSSRQEATVVGLWDLQLSLFTDLAPRLNHTTEQMTQASISREQGSRQREGNDWGLGSTGTLGAQKQTGWAVRQDSQCQAWQSPELRLDSVRGALWLSDLGQSLHALGLILPISGTSSGVGPDTSLASEGAAASMLHNCFHVGMWAGVAKSSKISVEAKNTDFKM